MDRPGQARIPRLTTAPRTGAVLVGLSGGLDSTVLLHLLASDAGIRQHGLRALHVHHGLHADADAWAAHCERACDALGVPLLLGGLIVGAVSMLLLAVQSRRGQRPFERVMMGLLLIVAIGFVAGLFVTGPSWPDAAGGLVPRFQGSHSVLLAASMLGATVMPHAIYVHSALARDRHGAHATDLPRLLRATRWDVGASMAVAGAVNIAMLLLAASSLQGVGGTESIQGAHAALTAQLGPAVGVLFAVGLLASGLASTSVGCYAGAAVMSGLLRFRVPMLARRAITLAPALIVLGLGIDPTWALVLSQVLLSMGIPFALAPLVRLTSEPALMGRFANSTGLRNTAWVVIGLISLLNVALLALTLTGAA